MTLGQSHLRKKNDKGIADSLLERLLKTQIIKGQRFYWVKWATAGKPNEWIAAKDIPEVMTDKFHKRYTLTGRRRRTNTQWKGNGLK